VAMFSGHLWNSTPKPASQIIMTDKGFDSNLYHGELALRGTWTSVTKGSVVTLVATINTDATAAIVVIAIGGLARITPP
jgi:hypothetical protein